jgi:DNA-binding NarL/FixJ family response regulator
VRVVIGEDLFLLRDGLVRLLEAHGFEIAAAGGTVLDPEVVARLMARRNRSGPLAVLTPREREVLALMAEGRSNAAIAARLFIAEKSVAKHAAGIFARLGLAPSDDDNRRVLVVLAYLNG